MEDLEVLEVIYLRRASNGPKPRGAEKISYQIPTFCSPAQTLLIKSIKNMFSSISTFSLLQVREETFSGLSNLNRLDLRYNNITELSDSVLWEMSDLTVLYLRGNQITSLPTEIFIYSNRLQILDLGKSKSK